ncbi:hypothetical protein D3C76_1702270 [compost metagenome]
MALDEVLDRYSVDLGVQTDLRYCWAYIEGTFAFETTVVEASAQGFQGDQAALALGFEVGVLDG